MGEHRIMLKSFMLRQLLLFSDIQPDNQDKDSRISRKNNTESAGGRRGKIIREASVRRPDRPLRFCEN